MGDVTIKTEEKKNLIEDGKLSALGVEVKISDIIGEKLINQWMSQCSPEDMKLIFDAINEEIYDYSYNKDSKKFKKLVERKDGYSWSGRTEESYLWKIMQTHIHDKINELILQKAQEIIDSKEYQDKAESIAQELVDYATEGYKVDLKERIRERLINNTINTMPSYNYLDLKGIIQQEVHNMLGHQ